MKHALICGVMLGGALAGLSGCATMSVADCQVADWQSIGYRDGTAGRATDYLQKHTKACSKADILPNTQQWEQGRQQGLKLYCTPSNAYQIGLAGDKLSLVCPINDLAELQYQNRRGLTLYAVTSAIDRDKRERDRLNEQYDSYYQGSNLGYKTRDKAYDFVKTIPSTVRRLNQQINDNERKLEQLRRSGY